MKNFISTSEMETLKLAANFAKTVPMGATIALHGDLGAGKTVFAHGFAKALDISEHITSPTFTIIQEYLIPDLKPKQWLFHMDLYRIADTNAGLAFGIDEYIDDKNAIKLIEWSKRIYDILPASTINVNIKHINETTRKISIDE